MRQWMWLSSITLLLVAAHYLWEPGSHPAPYLAIWPVVGMVAASLAGGAMSALSQSSANQTNIDLQREANQFNDQQRAISTQDARAMAREQMAFQERMSSSAYQRSMEDMRKAGLNPMLAYSQGGASTPSGASGSPGHASASAASVESERWGEGLQRSVGSALELTRLKKDIEQTDSSIALNRAAELAKQSEVKLNEASAKNVEANARYTSTRDKALGVQMPALKSQAELGEKQADFDKSANTYDNIVRRVGEAVGIIGSGAARSIRGLFDKGGPQTMRTESGRRVLRHGGKNYYEP